MSGSALPGLILPYAARPPHGRWGFDLAAGAWVGGVLGALLGIAIAASFTNTFFLISAGILIGITSAAVARSCRLLAVIVATAVALVIAMTTLIAYQYAVGHWPLDEATIEHYGNERSAVIRMTIGLLLLVCVPSVLAGAMTAFVRWCRRRA